MGCVPLYRSLIGLAIEGEAAVPDDAIGLSEKGLSKPEFVPVRLIVRTDSSRAEEGRPLDFWIAGPRDPNFRSINDECNVLELGILKSCADLGSDCPFHDPRDGTWMDSKED